MSGRHHLEEITLLANRLWSHGVEVIGHQFDGVDFGYWSIAVEHQKRRLRIISPGWRDGAYLTICPADESSSEEIRWGYGVSVPTPQGESAFSHAEREIIARLIVHKPKPNQSPKKIP